jgi:hypothetical protein
MPIVQKKQPQQQKRKKKKREVLFRSWGARIVKSCSFPFSFWRWLIPLDLKQELSCFAV